MVTAEQSTCLWGANMCYCSFMTAGFCNLCRCFALIENIRLEQATALDRVISSISINAHESIVGMGMAGTVHSVLMQCSPKIFDVCMYT